LKQAYIQKRFSPENKALMRARKDRELRAEQAWGKGLTC
jgi:hypothetical protein